MMPAVEIEKRLVAEAQASVTDDGTILHANRDAELDDFLAFLPDHKYICLPTGDLWPAASINSLFGPRTSDRLDKERPIYQMTWAPGHPQIIEDRILKDGGWYMTPGKRCFNRYRPAPEPQGDPANVSPWLKHIENVYPADSNHLINWLAQRVQRPHEKINHALVLGGGQGIGKDSILDPVKRAVGHWNFQEAGPQQLFGRFNGFRQSVVLRVSEARDLGDVDRYAFYEHSKVLTAAPPDTLRVDEKNIREFSIPNIVGVVITTNHNDGLYLPPDDRRHYVAWSDLSANDFADGYWRQLYAWYDEGGRENVAAYLGSLDISSFDAKEPPPKTEAWHQMVDAHRATEDAELADVIDLMGRPDALTLTQLAGRANDGLRAWLMDRKNRRQIPHRLESLDYVPVRCDTARDGLWVIGGKRQVVYVKRQLTLNARLTAARGL